MDGQDGPGKGSSCVSSELLCLTNGVNNAKNEECDDTQRKIKFEQKKVLITDIH